MNIQGNISTIANIYPSPSTTGYSSTAATSLLQRLRLLPAEQQGHPSIPAIDAGSTSGAGTSANGGSNEAHASLLPLNIHARPLGNVVYFMCSLNTPVEVRAALEGTLRRELGVGGK